MKKILLLLVCSVTILSCNQTVKQSKTPRMDTSKSMVDIIYVLRSGGFPQSSPSKIVTRTGMTDHTDTLTDGSKLTKTIWSTDTFFLLPTPDTLNPATLKVDRDSLTKKPIPYLTFRNPMTLQKKFCWIIPIEAN